MSIATDKIDNSVELEVGKPDEIETTAGEANDTNVTGADDSKADNELQNLKPSAADDDDDDDDDHAERPSEIENLKAFDPFADEGTAGVETVTRRIIHIRIQQRNGRKTLTTVQGLPKKFDQRKILKVIKKKFACNGTTVVDRELGEVIQLQGDQRKHAREFLIDKKEGLGLDEREIKVHGF